MDLSIREKDGKKFYIVTDNIGYAREVTLDSVLSFIDSGELNNCYSTIHGDIVQIKGQALHVPPNATYKLLGRFYNQQDVLEGYLIQRLADLKVLKGTEDVLVKLAKTGNIIGAYYVDGTGVLFDTKLDKYKQEIVNGVPTPKKVKQDKIKLPKAKHTIDIEIPYMDVIETTKELATKAIRSNDKGNVLGGDKRFPFLTEIKSDGLSLNIDGVQLSATIDNLSDLVSDIAYNAELTFIVRHDRVGVVITDIDYRLDAFHLVVSILLAYKKLYTQFASLRSVIINGNDGTYWSRTFELASSQFDKKVINYKLHTDIKTLQSQYECFKSKQALDLASQPNRLSKLLGGLKTGVCFISVVCQDCIFTSTKYALDDRINNTLYIHFQTTSGLGFEDDLNYKGNAVNYNSISLDKVCLIAALIAAENHIITSVGVTDTRDNISYDIMFKQRNEFGKTTPDLMHELNN